MIDNTALQECPFCGGKFALEWHNGEDSYLCNCCGVRISMPQASITHLTDIVNSRAEPANEPLTLDELREMLERIEEERRQACDGHEDYTNGYRWGHRNGQMELLRRILKVGDGVCERDRRKPEPEGGAR